MATAKEQGRHTADFKTRVSQFNTMQLPGQPMGMHMGTAYLVNDLWAVVQKQTEALEGLLAGHEINDTLPDEHPVVVAYAAIRAARGEVMSGERREWQPIETAPKDGTEVLAICAEAPSPIASITWWDGTWLTFSKPEKFISHNPHKWFPTDWMPLPGPPEDCCHD